MPWKLNPDIRRETQVFLDRRYNRYPDSKRKAHRLYFARAGGHHLLHRDVWIHFNGPIPVGHEIHHKDENPANNDITNLECITIKEHRARHRIAMLRWMYSDEAKAMRRHARELAKDWHRSEEGRAWHRQHAQDILDPRACVCRWCGKEFIAKRKNAVNYCCNSHSSSHWQKKDGISPHTGLLYVPSR